MDWKSVAGPILKQFAPKLAGVLVGQIPIVGGFLSGTAEDAVGKLLADQFGVDATPEAVSAAINSVPLDIAAQKLAAAEAEGVARWSALASMHKDDAEVAKASIEQVNASIREEYAVKTFSFWDKWRAIHAFELTAEMPFVLAGFMYLILGNKVEMVRLIVEMSGLITVYIGARFGVLGVHVNALSNERQTAMTGQPASGPIGTLVKQATGKLSPR